MSTPPGFGLWISVLLLSADHCAWSWPCPSSRSHLPCLTTEVLYYTPGHLRILESVLTAQGPNFCFPFCSQVFQGSQDVAGRVVCQQCLVWGGVKSRQGCELGPKGDWARMNI